MEYPKFKVTVSCMTYNQSKYITDAMNGFTMQQTDFPFVCTIVDDASTDGEQEVIRKYVEENFDFSEGSAAFNKETDYAFITYAQHKTNKNCYFAVLYLKENHYSQKKDKSPYLKEWRDGVEYMAICEGDDYWIVPDKLQVQYDILEHNPNYSFVYTGFNVVNQEGVILEGHKFEKRMESSYSGNNYFNLLVNMNYIMTLTTFFRIDAIYIKPGVYDYGIFLNASRLGYAYYLPNRTSNYRINPNSIMNTCPEILRPLMYNIILEEIKQSLKGESISPLICKDKEFKTVVGYVLARNIYHSTMRKEFVKVAVVNPSIWPWIIKGLIIKITNEKSFRESFKTSKR